MMEKVSLAEQALGPRRTFISACNQSMHARLAVTLYIALEQTEVADQVLEL